MIKSITKWRRGVKFQLIEFLQATSKTKISTTASTTAVAAGDTVSPYWFTMAGLVPSEIPLQVQLDGVEGLGMYCVRRSTEDPRKWNG